MKISILTATLPERADMLAEAKASVERLEHPAYIEIEHIVLTDDKREGAGALLSDALQLSSGSWVMVLDDDDLLLPDHIAVVAPIAATDQFDVIYTQPEVVGGVFDNYHQPFDSDRLKRRNIVSHNALMRSSFVKQVGDWNNVRTFDWDLFKRLDERGAKFLQVPIDTWVYRLHGANWSHGQLEGAMQ